MRLALLIVLACGTAACGGFGWHKRAAPRPRTEIVLTGAPAGSLVFVDGVQTGPGVEHNDQSEILDVAPGAHTVEIHVNEAVVYREETYVGSGERRVVEVLSGLSR